MKKKKAKKKIVIKRQKLKPTQKPKKEKKKDLNVVLAIEKTEKQIADILGTKVKINDKNNRGKIQIEYYSAGDLERIIKIISGSEKNDL